MIIPPAIAVLASRRPVTRDLCVTHIGTFVAAGEHFVERPHGTSQYILIACISGNGSCLLKGQEWKLGPGDLLFLPPHEGNLYRANPAWPWTIFWVHFRGLRVDDYLANLGVSPTFPVLSIDGPSVLIEAFEDTFRHTTHGFSESAMTGLSTAFARLLGLARVHQRAPGSRKRHAEGRLLKMLALMRENLAANGRSKNWHPPRRSASPTSPSFAGARPACRPSAC